LQASQWAIRHGSLISLSIQNLVDCVDTCDGCNGGLITDAFNYVVQKQNGHFMSEADYPYVARDGSCKYESSKGVTTLIGMITTPPDDEVALKAAVYNDGVAAVGIDASTLSFQLYMGGIYDPDDCSTTHVNHVMMLVGYGVAAGVPFWILQNNWGSSWGENGYMRLIRNAGNKCGIATSALFPVDQT
jgi:cathepsin L